jgi:pimeloyl-ACP methyl ester carboxylesterase
MSSPATAVADHRSPAPPEAGRNLGPATLEPHVEVRGTDIAKAEIRARGATPWREIAWDELRGLELPPGDYELRAFASVSENHTTLEVPPCAGRKGVAVDGRNIPSNPGPRVIAITPGQHELALALSVSAYERRIACGERPRVGASVRTVEGLSVLHFDSPHGARGGGSAVVFLPPGHDTRRPGPVLVGAHPWNGSIWTYAAYAELLQEARARDVVLLFPSGLGNSLYTAEAEDEVMRAIDALGGVLAVDPRAVSIWGASMGGAGATTIGLHHPDRFAMVTSFFGDSKYDLGTYVRGLLADERAAHLVNALDVIDNARHLPVWLVHGDADRTSPIRQSRILADGLGQRGFSVRFDAVRGAGHSGALVTRFLPAVVAAAATARVPSRVSRVTYRSVRREDAGAYGVRLDRNDDQDGSDAFIDVERRDDGVHVLRAEGVRAVKLERGALGTDADHPPPIRVDAPGPIAGSWLP